MRRIAFLCLCLVLVGCDAPRPWRDSSLDGARPPPKADGPVMRRLLGQDPGVEPLLPEPGDIWAAVQLKAPSAGPATASAERPASPTLPPARVALAPEPAHRPAASPAATHGTGTTSVQIVAAGSAKRAEAEWAKLRQRVPGLVRGHRPTVTGADVEGHKVWRLRADGFATVAEADAFCASVRAVKAKCWVVGP